MPRLIAPLSVDERAGLIAAARSLLTAGPNGAAVPFRHRGRSVRGVDCLGTVVVAMAAIGREMQDRDAYGRDPVADGIAQAAREHFGAPIYHRGMPLDVLQPGDIVLMQWHQQPNHVAIVTDYCHGGLAVIHAYSQVGHVVEHGLSDPWPRRIVEGFR